MSKINNINKKKEKTMPLVDCEMFTVRQSKINLKIMVVNISWTYDKA